MRMNENLVYVYDYPDGVELQNFFFQCSVKQIVENVTATYVYESREFILFTV